MAVGDFVWPEMHKVTGIALSSAAAGIKHTDRDDVALMAFEEGATVSSVFTKNTFAAAPVHIAKANLQSECGIRFLLINSGNANACTGAAGEKACHQTCNELARLSGVTSTQVLPFSTGVIGEVLPAEKICQALPQALDGLSEDKWDQFAAAILTTDTRKKGVSKVISWQGESFTLTGVAKGSGMIQPNMATMLAYFATDLKIEAGLQSKLLQDLSDKSFNCITVDGDTSTNDACVLVSSGKSTAPMLTQDNNEFYLFVRKEFLQLFRELAQQIVLDGEGATKFVEVQVVNGRSYDECRAVAFSVANSPLVKTAIFAQDANWGRIVMAAGNSGLDDIDPSQVDVFLDDVKIVDSGGRAVDYTEEQGAEVLKRERFTIKIDLKIAKESAEVWTTDLSYEYIKINAEYRT